MRNSATLRKLSRSPRTENARSTPNASVASSNAAESARASTDCANTRITDRPPNATSTNRPARTKSGAMTRTFSPGASPGEPSAPDAPGCAPPAHTTNAHSMVAMGIMMTSTNSTMAGSHWTNEHTAFASKNANTHKMPASFTRNMVNASIMTTTAEPTPVMMPAAISTTELDTISAPVVMESSVPMEHRNADATITPESNTLPDSLPASTAASSNAAPLAYTDAS